MYSIINACVCVCICICLYVYMYMFIYYLVDGSYFSNDFGHTWYQLFEHNFSWRGVASDIYLENVYATTFGDGRYTYFARCLCLSFDMIKLPLLFILYFTITNMYIKYIYIIVL